MALGGMPDAKTVHASGPTGATQVSDLQTLSTHGFTQTGGGNAPAEVHSASVAAPQQPCKEPRPCGMSRERTR